MPRITVKGQVTIPKEIREHFGVKSGDLVDFILKEDKVYLQFKKGTILDAITKKPSKNKKVDK